MARTDARASAKAQRAGPRDTLVLVLGMAWGAAGQCRCWADGEDVVVIGIVRDDNNVITDFVWRWLGEVLRQVIWRDSRSPIVETALHG